MSDETIMGILALAQSNRPQHHHHNTNVNVTEHRAPTDDSVALLKEMEEKSEDKLLARIPIADNGFECDVYIFKVMNDAEYGLKLATKFSLNGKKFIVEDVVDLHRASFVDPREMFDNIVKKVSDEITREVLQGAFANAISNSPAMRGF